MYLQYGMHHVPATNELLPTKLGLSLWQGVGGVSEC